MPKVKLNQHEYETIYRILITSSVESVGEQRNLNDILEAFEKAGTGIGAESNGVPRMYTIERDITLELPAAAPATLRDHLDRGHGAERSLARDRQTQLRAGRQLRGDRT